MAVAALGLCLYIYLFEVPKMQIEAKGDHVVEFEPAQTERIRLSYPNAAPLELTKKDGRWSLVAPVQAPADTNAVDLFLGAVRDATVERRIPSGEAGSAAGYGLDKEIGSQARLELTTAGGTVLPAVIVGNTTPVDFHAFVRVEGSDDVLVTPLIFHTSVRKTPFDFRTKTLLTVDPQSILRLTLDNGSDKIVLEKKGEDWNLISPIADRADVEATLALTAALPTIEALAYFDGAEVDRKRFGLAPPSLVVKADVGEGEPVGFGLGAKGEEAPAGFYFERNGDAQVAKVGDWVAGTYGVTVNDVRDRRMLLCFPAAVLRMVFTRDGETFTLSREGIGKPWTMDGAAAGESVSQRIADITLESLAQLKGDKVVGDGADAAAGAAYGLDRPLARVELDTKDGPCGGVTAGSREPGAASPVFYLKGDGRSAVVTASASQMSRLTLKRADFLESKATTPP